MKLSPKITAVVLCAGLGSRANLGYNKVLHTIGNLSVGASTARKFDEYDLVVVCANEDDEAQLKSEINRPDAIFVRGGATRTESVRNALSVIKDSDIVIIHDGARPFVSKETIKKSVDSAIAFGSGVVGVRSVNALRSLKSDGTSSALDRDTVFTVQTPQTFRFFEIKKAYDGFSGVASDDSEVYEKAGFSVNLVEGESDNIKLTTPADFLGLNGIFRIGYGFDVHQLVANRKLILCGKEFDYPLGLLGHSDADVPVHALMDALLSALSMPDIGVLFPDTDEQYLGADSIELLKKVVTLSNEFEIVNVSICIMAQKPKLASSIPQMRQNLADALNIDVNKVNVSATTTESLGIVGEGKGIASSAEVLIKRK